MGYLKSGSQKSLLAGGLSASLLYYVYTQLPTRPVIASSIGLGKTIILFSITLNFLYLCCNGLSSTDYVMHKWVRLLAVFVHRHGPC
jgi:hypothetical protein